MKNRVISMFYELKNKENGEILETNFNANEITFITGFNQIIKKLEDTVINLNEGDESIIVVGPKDGIGDYETNKLQTLPKEQFAGIELKEGMELFGEDENGRTARVIVKEIGENDVMVDFNHPYAGKTLEFKIKVTKNREATDDEITMQRPEGEHTCSCGHHHEEKEHKCCGRHKHD